MKHTPHTLLKAPTPRPSPPRKQSSPIKQATPRQDLGAVTNDNLVSCQYCNRRFAKDRLEKHQEICAKTTHKKRKPYDALKHRVIGTEAEAYVKKGTKQQPVSNTYYVNIGVVVTKMLSHLFEHCTDIFLFFCGIFFIEKGGKGKILRLLKNNLY